MKLYCHISSQYSGNIYVLTSGNSREAVIVDPVYFDEDLFRLIANNGYNLNGVLVTRINEKRIHGIHTLLRIYDAKIIAGGLNHLQGNICEPDDSGSGSIAGLNYEILISENYNIYRIGTYVFTGNGFTSGHVSEASVKQLIMTLEDDCIILPGFGPPTTVAAEREWNPRMQIVNHSLT